MKIRTGFVSNSSSSSFICDITGKTSTCSDGQWCDGAGPIMECICGHYFLSKFLIMERKAKTIKEMRDELCAFTHINELDLDAINLKIEFKDPFTEGDIDLFTNISITDSEVRSIYSKFSLDNISKCYKIMINDSDGDDAYDDVYAYDDVQVPSFRCPLCSFKHVKKDAIIAYMATKLYGVNGTLNDAEQNIIREFKNEKELNKFLKGKSK